MSILALAASGLKKLELPAETLNMFPIAFLQGMAHRVRADMLADTGDDKPATWQWGAGENAPDARDPPLRCR